jgi:hypothetical protein
VTVDLFSVTLSQPENGMFTVLTMNDTTQGGGYPTYTYGSLWPVNATVADGALTGAG